MSKPKTTINGRITLAAAAKAFGVHQNTIQSWYKRGCPRTSIERIFSWSKDNVAYRSRRDGQNRLLEEVVAAYHALPGAPPRPTAPNPHPPAGAVPTAPEPSPSTLPTPFDLRHQKAAEDLEKTREQTRKLRMENDLAAGRVVPRDEAERFLSELVIEARTQLEQLPERMRMTFPPEQREFYVAEVHGHVADVLQRIADWRPKMGDVYRTAGVDDPGDGQ